MHLSLAKQDKFNKALNWNRNAVRQLQLFYNFITQNVVNFLLF
jgi:hypothetical protein